MRRLLTTLVLLAPLFLLFGCDERPPEAEKEWTCWTDLPSPGAPEELVDDAVTRWNERDASRAYVNSYGATPLPAGPDEIVIGAFRRTGRTWTVPSEGSGTPFDIVGCLPGDRVLVEGVADVASAAGYFRVTNQPLYLDAPRSGEGQYGVYHGENLGTMRYLEPLDVADEFGTEVEVGHHATSALETQLAGRGETWADEAVWRVGLELGDVPGRVSLNAYDPASAWAEQSRYESEANLLDGTFVDE